MHLPIQTAVASTINLLWALEREPKLFVLEETDPTHENRRLARLGKKARLSPVRTVRIDAVELRRLESTRAADIEAALKEKGHYTIPGLVLVAGGYVRKNGTRVAPYARCANEDVRRKATEFLREENYAELATLVDTHGQESTKARFAATSISGISQIEVISRRPQKTAPRGGVDIRQEPAPQ